MCIYISWMYGRLMYVRRSASTIECNRLGGTSVARLMISLEHYCISACTTPTHKYTQCTCTFTWSQIDNFEPVVLNQQMVIIVTEQVWLA